MKWQNKKQVASLMTAVLFAVLVSACGKVGMMDPGQGGAPSMNDPVAQFPDDPVNPVAPEPPPPAVASYSYSGTGN
jgi:hypothetical protein